MPAGIVFAVLLLSSWCAHSDTIRLRNPLASPAAKSLDSAGTALDSAASNLQLVQFDQPPDRAARDTLQAAGITLLQYIPENTFIARFEGVNLATLPLVAGMRVVGPYRPEYKVHASVAAAAAANSAPGRTIPVSILLHRYATPSEIALARRAFKALKQESHLRAGTVLRGHLQDGQLQILAASPAVLWIEPARDMKMSDEVASKLVAGDGGPQRLLTQELGFDGSGVAVAVADSGLNNGDAATMHPDLEGRTPAFIHYGNLLDAADEHSHGTHVAGIVAGNGATGEVDENGALYGLGVAPGAEIIAQRIFDGVGGYEAPPSFERLTRDAVRAGADIGSNSWGDDTAGRYDISAMEFDELVRDADALTLGDQQYILEFSAGNAGPATQTIGSPALAKNVIATGASQNDRPDFLMYGDGPEVMADFSSRGPCEDGRIKPDVTAPGTYIASLQSASATDQYAWAPISPYYQYQGGTSQAGPHASGAAAVFVQYYRSTHAGATPSPALVKAALINSAVDLLGFDTVSTPNSDEGWGRIDLPTLFDSALQFDLTDQTVLMTNAQVFERQFVITGDSPLKITLTYSDVPGFPGAVPALVNDLDLEVIGPDLAVYRGNQFTDGESIPNPVGPDGINNVEGVHLSYPVPGMYVVRVRASRVVEDARQESPAIEQDFALVVSGSIPGAGTGVISMDRGNYRVPDVIKLQVTDTDLAGTPSVSVRITSTQEPLGENVVLTLASTFGVFTGSVATATGAALADGKLQIANGSTIQATYQDQSPAVARIATANADFQAPEIQNVASNPQFGFVVISYTTSEPARSILRLGTQNNPANLNFAVTNSSLTVTQETTLDGLLTGVRYYFLVEAADEAGNRVTNNNNGALFSFIIPAPPAVLLVDSFIDDPMTLGAPPLSGYTDPLNQLGIGFDTWAATNATSPSLETLKKYRAVIWRVPELVGVWSATDRSAISNYLDAGGSLLVASMEVLTRLEEANATSFIHDVLRVQSFTPDPSSTGAGFLEGSTLDPLTSGFSATTDFTVYDDLWGGLVGPDISDTLSPATNATVILRNDLGDPIGLRWPGLGQQGNGRLVLLSFPLDAVPMGTGENDRIGLLRSLLSFLAPGTTPTASLSLDSQAYRVPGHARVQIGDSDLVGQPSATVQVWSSTQPTPFVLTLLPKGSPGLFEGEFDILPGTNPPTPGAVRAVNGDTIQVAYQDASAGSTVTTTAAVDNTPPVISLVEHEADYVSAIIYWDTSEPTDSLVQFGESKFLGRTAYDSDFTTGHGMQLSFLAPDRDYYFQVVSRDAAGNAVIDDNSGRFYTFRTLRPLITPWEDNLDSGATNWTTYSDPAFTTPGVTPEWTLGVPSNLPGVSAHSSPNAWGSNLDGKPADLAECYLISPAIYLTNGNVATLRYWQNYEFTDISGFDIEFGQLMLITSDSEVAYLADFFDTSFDWEEIEINLTPYMGKVVYLAWYYFLFSMDSAPRPGWLVDDISISVSTVAPGTINVTNNLWQAQYILSGATSRKGAGKSAVLTNMPPGEYVMEYPEIPYYTAPTAQTNTLVSGGTITFQGIYSFVDTNGNSIADAWESAFLGNVSAFRTSQTDTDGDGMTDLEEFLAGTDPTRPPPAFRLTVTRNSPQSVRLEWPSAPGQQYRVHSSSNLVAWFPFGSWIEATSAVSRVDVPITTGGLPAYFKVQVAVATNAPIGLPENLRASAQRQPNGSIRLAWNSVRGRGYRVEGSSNTLSWSPVSDWIRATGPSTSYTVPATAPASPSYFRVEVQP